MPIKRTYYERFDRGGKDCAVAEIEGASARQCLLADYETSVQHGAERIYDVVQAGTAAGLHQGHSERLASVTRSPRPRFVVYHHPNVGHSEAGRRSRRQRINRTGA